MTIETIYGQVVAKANHYMAVPAKDGMKRIIKDDVIREYENSFRRQCKVYKGRMINQPFRFICDVYNRHNNYDLDNSLKTILDCLQDCEAITNDNLMKEIRATKQVSQNPRVEFRIEVLQKDLFGELP